MELTGVFDPAEAKRIEEQDPQMHEKANVPAVEVSRDESIQPRADEDLPQNQTYGGFRGIGSLYGGLSFFYQSADLLPVWWSEARDIALAEFWRSVDLTAGAMYAMASKIATIPWHVEPRDSAITSHFIEAERTERRIRETAEYGAGWGQFIQKQMLSLLGQDNGRFMEIIDASPNKDGPIFGPVLSVAHLDPSRCRRTANIEYPVVYLGIDGRRRKLHWTRVAIEAHMPSERVDMYGVGLCAISRAAAYAQRILDINKFNEEKLGSRPTRGIMLLGGGLDAEAAGMALQVAYQEMDSRQLSRFSTVPILGSPDIEDPSIELISLSELPDGFDEEKATTIAMSAIALAFGVDARELWPVTGAGATRADAILSHVKQRGKGPGHIIAETERMFNNWVLPPFLRFVFDFQDDAQDRQRAEIERERSLSRKTNLEYDISDQRTERQRMLREGVLTNEQFARLELQDGRLPGGAPLETLFFIDDPIYKEILTLSGIADPLDLRGNDADVVLDAISAQLPIGFKMAATLTGENKTRKVREGIAALLALAEDYTAIKNEIGTAAEQEAEQREEGDRIDPESRQREEAIGSPEDRSAVPESPNSDEANISSENSPRELKWIEKIFKRKPKQSD